MQVFDLLVSEASSWHGGQRWWKSSVRCMFCILKSLAILQDVLGGDVCGYLSTCLCNTLTKVALGAV